MSPTAKAQLQIHFCVVLWGFTAILGKAITLPALPLVWWRMLIVVAALALVPSAWRGLRALSPRLVLAYAGIGALVALHWLTFYGSIKLANASVAATCMALATPFTAIVEPVLARRPFSGRDLALGIAVLPGVALIVGGVPDAMRGGIAVGALSAFFVALFGSLNKRLVHHGEPLTVTGLELGAGVLTLTILAPLMPIVFPAFAGNLFVVPGAHDALLLLALSLLCTLLPFALSLVALRHMTAFAAQLAINLEPVYAIVLAALFFDEQRELTTAFYIGVAILLVALFVHPLLNRTRKLTQPELLATAEAKSSIE
ncbi:MAG: DMT family transporter [Rhodanobacteraceae bacterium]